MSRVIRSLFLLSVVVAAAGCSDWGSSEPARLFTRFGGRVVNADTGAPISGVVVKICNYEYQATTDGDGHWFMEIIPGLEETDVIFTFERSGYASVMFSWGFDVDDELDVENRDFHDTGTQMMRAGVSVMVQVTLDGAPLAGASVICSFGEFYFDGSYEYTYDFEDYCTDLQILATTDAAGIATLNNVDPKQDYVAYVPMQDLDGDNIPDTTDGQVGISVTYLGMVYAIGLERMEPYGTTLIRGHNLAWFEEYFDRIPTGAIDGDAAIFPYGMSDLGYRWYYYGGTELVSFDKAVITPNHSVQLVFRNPVDVFQAQFTYYNNLVALADPLFEEEIRIPATATAVSGSKFTIYNFIPATLLPTNEYVTLRFIARSQVNPAMSDNLSISFYVPLGLPTITVAADNYNGSRDGTGVGPHRVWLRFPEAVEGFYKILSITEDGTTYTNPFPQQIWFPWYNGYFPYTSDLEIANNEEAAPATGSNLGESGAVAGKQVKVRLSYYGYGAYDNQVPLDDAVPATSANAVTVEISCRNILGVTLDTVVTLPIQ